MNVILVITSALIGLTSEAEVIIIGAGMSGLGAARKLVNTGGYAVTVLEARGRVGGRTWTDKDAVPGAIGAEVDKGASWIHDASAGHPIKELADKFNLQTKATDDENRNEVYDSDGNELPYSFWVNFQQLLESIASEYDDPDKSVWEAIQELDEETFARSPGGAYAITDILEFNTGGSVEDVAASAVAAVIEKKRRRRRKRAATQELLIVEGYIGIVEGLIKGATGETEIDVVNSASEGSAPRIILNSPVSRVESIGNDTNPRVRVTSGSDTYEGDYVIITVPLGVLKSNTITFSPALSQEKLTAIANLGFGNVNKLILQWDQSFWDSESELDTFGIAEDTWNDRGMLVKYLNGKRILDRPVLVTYMFGPDADESESLSLTELKNRAITNLEKLFDSVPQPTDISRSTWGSDPYSKGCYSYPKVGFREYFYDDLAKHACPFLFAGEHTYAPAPSTTTGAYLSGLRAADQVLAAVKGGCSSVTDSDHSTSTHHIVSPTLLTSTVIYCITSVIL